MAYRRQNRDQSAPRACAACGETTDEQAPPAISDVTAQPVSKVTADARSYWAGCDLYEVAKDITCDSLSQYANIYNHWSDTRSRLRYVILMAENAAPVQGMQGRF